MKFFIASDHAGFELKTQLIQERTSGIIWEDCGPSSKDSVDYPDTLQILCEKLRPFWSKNSEASLESCAFGVLICGSGLGMSMGCNRFPWIRGALCHNEEYASLSRRHNDANVLCLGARFLTLPMALSILDSFKNASFEGGRHSLRVEKLTHLTFEKGVIWKKP